MASRSSARSWERATDFPSIWARPTRRCEALTSLAAASTPGVPAPFGVALIEGGKTALLTLLVYLLALPLVWIAGAGVLVFFLATAWLLGREYFELAATRFRPVQEARAMRRYHATRVFLAGCFIAAFVSIPVVNLATPLFAMALMVHLHKRWSRPLPGTDLPPQTDGPNP